MASVLSLELRKYLLPLGVCLGGASGLFKVLFTISVFIELRNAGTHTGTHTRAENRRFAIEINLQFSDRKNERNVPCAPNPNLPRRVIHVVYKCIYVLHMLSIQILKD